MFGRAQPRSSTARFAQSGPPQVLSSLRARVVCTCGVLSCRVVWVVGAVRIRSACTQAPTPNTYLNPTFIITIAARTHTRRV